MQEFEKCPFGIIGLETAMGLALERLVHPGKISCEQMVELFTTRSRRGLGNAWPRPAYLPALPPTSPFSTQNAPGPTT